MTTVFTPHFIAGAIAYILTNMAINNSAHGWHGVIAGGVVSGLAAVLLYGKKENK